jgi:hypothetical protein
MKSTLKIVSVKSASRLAVLLSCIAMCGVQAAEPLPIFARQELSKDLTLEGDTFHLPTVFGPTGLSGWIFDGALVVRAVAEGSPADGLVLPADMILSVDEQPFGTEPLWTLGKATMEAEKTGRLSLAILRDGKPQSVTLPLRTMPHPGRDWPFACMPIRICFPELPANTSAASRDLSSVASAKEEVPDF